MKVATITSVNALSAFKRVEGGAVALSKAGALVIIQGKRSGKIVTVASAVFYPLGK